MGKTFGDDDYTVKHSNEIIFAGQVVLLQVHQDSNVKFLLLSIQLNAYSIGYYLL